MQEKTKPLRIPLPKWFLLCNSRRNRQEVIFSLFQRNKLLYQLHLNAYKFIKNFLSFLCTKRKNCGKRAHNFHKKSDTNTKQIHKQIYKKGLGTSCYCENAENPHKYWLFCNFFPLCFCIAENFDTKTQKIRCLFFAKSKTRKPA